MTGANNTIGGSAYHQLNLIGGNTGAGPLVAFGFTRFRNYRVRVLLYAGKPNWDLLATITPR